MISSAASAGPLARLSTTASSGRTAWAGASGGAIRWGAARAPPGEPDGADHVRGAERRQQLPEEITGDLTTGLLHARRHVDHRDHTRSRLGLVALEDEPGEREHDRRRGRRPAEAGA